MITWARQRFDQVSGPGRDGDDPMLCHSRSTDRFLSEDICVILMKVRHRYDEMTLAIIDHQAVYVLGPMQEWADVIDWSRAFGGCVNGHTFVVEEARYLHSARPNDPSDLCRLPGDGSPNQGGHVACPDCADGSAERVEFLAERTG